MKRTHVALAVTLAALSLSQGVARASPGMRLQGQLANAAGEPTSGLVGLTVRIYAAPSGGTALYSESFSQMITAGALDVILGAGLGTTTDDIVAAMSPQQGETGLTRYLGIQIDGDDTELSPRRRVTGGAFATYALNAATLGGQPSNFYATTQQLSSYATTQELANYVTTQQAQNYVTTQQAQNYVTTQQAQTFVTNEQITQALASYVQANPTTPAPVTFAASAPVTFAQPQGTAPFAVQSTTVVQNLNCDRIDGISADQLARTDIANIFRSDQVVEGTARFEGANTFVGAAAFQGANTFAGATAFTRAQGTAPFSVTSSTLVTNLNCDFLDGVSGGSFARIDLPNVYQGEQVFAGAATFEGAVTFAAAQGTAPFAVQSTTVVPNLNAEMLGGQTAAGFARLGATNTFSAAQSFASGATFAGQATFSSNASFAGNATFGGATTFGSTPTFSTGATFAGPAAFNASVAFNAAQGSAPFAVSSTTQVNSLNAALLNGKTAAEIVTEAGGGACTSCSNALALNGQPASFYVNASNLSTGTVPNAALPSNLARTNTSATPFEDGFLSLRASASVVSTTLHGTATVARDITFPDATGTVVTTGNLAAITALPGLSTPITPAQGGLGISTAGAVAGDLLVATGAGQWALLPKSTGSDGQVLKLVSGAPAWGTDNTGSAGTLPISSGGTGGTTAAAARTNLGVAASGANSDITSLSGLTTPLSPAQGGLGINSGAIAAGDILYASGAGQWAILPKLGAVDGQVLKLQSGVPAWGTDNTGGGGGGGTLTSVAAGTGLTISGSPNPITSSGTISVDTAVIPRLASANAYTNTQSITSPAAGSVPVTVTGAASQTANLQEWKSSGGSTLGSVSNAGAVTAASFSGGGTGLTALNATQLTSGTVPDARLSANVATLSGAQTVSGVKTFLDGTVALRSSATAFATTLHGTASASARDITFPDVNGTVITSGNLTGITATGTIASGVWQGTPVGVAYGGLGQDTTGAARGAVLYKNAGGLWQPLAPGSAGQVLKTGGAGADPSWQADSAGTGTVQSITAGTGISLSANPIVTSGVISVDSATVPLLAASNTFTGGQVLQPSSAVGIPLTAQGALGQTGDLQRWLDGSGSTVASVSADGDLIASSFAGDGSLLTSLPAAQLTGTIADARLSANVATTNTAQTLSAAKTFLNAMLLLRNAGNTASTTLATATSSNNTLTFPNGASGNIITAGNPGDISGTLGNVTITQGTWNGSVIGGAYGGTGMSVQTPATGAILYKTGSAGTSAWTATTAPSSGHVLRYNGTNWVPASLASSDVSGVATLSGNNSFTGSNSFSSSANFTSTATFASTATFTGTAGFNNNVTMTSLNSASTPLTINGVASQSQPLINLNGVASQTSALMSLNANTTHSGNIFDIRKGGASVLTLNSTGALSNLTGLSLASGTLSLPVGTTLTVNGASSLSNVSAMTVAAAGTLSLGAGSTLSAGTANLTGTLSGGTLSASTLSGSTLAGALTTASGATLNASNLTVTGGAFNNGTFSGSFSGSGAGLSGVSSGQRYYGNLQAGCNLRAQGANTEVVCGTTVCWNSANSRPTVPCRTLYPPANPCRLNCIDSFPVGSGGSGTVPQAADPAMQIGRFQLATNGSWKMSLTRSIACVYTSDIGQKTLNASIYFCPHGGCGTRPAPIASDSTTISPFNNTIALADGPYAVTETDFVETQAGTAVDNVSIEIEASLADVVGQSGGETYCFFIKRDERVLATATPSPLMSFTFSPVTTLSTW